MRVSIRQRVEHRRLVLPRSPVCCREHRCRGISAWATSLAAARSSAV